jgi:hypothetical protein
MLKNRNNLFNSQLNQTLFFIKNYIIVYYIINMLKKLKETKMKKPKAKPKPKQKQKQKQNVKQIVKVNVQSTGGGGSGGASAIPPSFSNRTGENVALLNIIDQLKQSIRPPIQPPSQISTRTEGQPEIPYDPVNDKATVNNVFNAPNNNDKTTWEAKTQGRPKLTEEEKQRKVLVKEEAKAIAKNEALQKLGQKEYEKVLEAENKKLEAELSKKEQISGGGKKNKSTKSKGAEMRFPITNPYFEGQVEEE